MTLIFIAASSLVFIVLVYYYFGQRFENFDNETETVKDLVLLEQTNNKKNFGEYLAKNFAKHFANKIAQEKDVNLKKTIVAYLNKHYNAGYTTKNISSKLKKIEKSDANFMLLKFQNDVDNYDDDVIVKCAYYLANDRKFRNKFNQDFKNDDELLRISYE